MAYGWFVKPNRFAQNSKFVHFYAKSAIQGGLGDSTRSGSGIFKQCLPGKRDHVVHWFAGVLDAPEAAGVLLPQVLDQKLLEGERWKEKPIHT